MKTGGENALRQGAVWRLVALGVPVIVMTIGAGSAQAQFPASTGPDSSAPAPYGASAWSAGSYFSGGAAYVPFSAGMGGFVPYQGGPGGGLGVQQPTRSALRPMPAEGGGMGMLGTGSPLGVRREAFAPLAPLGTLRSGGMRGRGMSGTLFPGQSPAAGMRRPPVGSYPFRIPPSLLGPATASPGMSM